MYCNYRVYLSNNFTVSDLQNDTEKMKQIFDKTKELGLVRVAIDLTSDKKSISLLYNSKDTLAIEDRLIELLLEKNIDADEIIDKERFSDKKEKAQDAHQHASSPEDSSPVKKSKKKSKHKHSSKHEHDQCTKHTHKHEHEHEHEHSHAQCTSHGHSHGHDNHWLKATLGLIWGIGLLALSVASFNIPMTAYYVITGLSTLMTLYLGYTVYQSTWEALRKKEWDDPTILYTISTLTIVAVSIASMFVPGLPMMFEAAPLVLGFWHLAEGVEHTLIGEIDKNLDVRNGITPEVLLKGNPDKEVDVTTLIPNDIIFVKKGDFIPVDGVLTGAARLYTNRIDGSPEVKLFQPGDAVKSGMRLNDDIPSLQMRVTKTYQNSYLSLVAKNISQANEEKAPVELFANRVLKYFIPGLLAVAFVSGIVISSLFTPALAIQCVISVLVSACPCALKVITPMAVTIGMKKASEEGIQFKNGKALQASADVDIIVFDLNGTLTKGNIEVNIEIENADQKFLSHIALLEEQSDHPVAKRIVTHIRDNYNVSSDAPLTVTSVDKSHHSGIKGEINGEIFMIGNQDMLLDNGVTDIDKPYDDPENGSVYIVRGTKVIGQINVSDDLREDALATVKELQRLGKEVHMCTGADRKTAEKYAPKLGIHNDHICATAEGVDSEACEEPLMSPVILNKELNSLNVNQKTYTFRDLNAPTRNQNNISSKSSEKKEGIPGKVSKKSYIQGLKSKGFKVAMVGDSTNDLGAIAEADIGIAVQSSIGDAVTQQHAGIVLQKGLLFPIATAFDVAQKTKNNIYQNLFVSLTYNSTVTLVAAGLFVALGITLNPAIGVALVVLESTLVLTNLIRFKQQEILSSASISKNSTTDPEHSETTANVLVALGGRLQPKRTFTVVQSPSPFFKPKIENATSNDAILDPQLEIKHAAPYRLDEDRQQKYSHSNP